jgi:hypothetical protein
MNPARLPWCAAAAAAAGLAGAGAYMAVAWARYGHADPRRHPRDELLDRFVPEPEVDEYHQLRARPRPSPSRRPGRWTSRTPCSQGRVLAAGDPLLAAWRAVPAAGIERHPGRDAGHGWGVLAEVSGREIVIGAYTQHLVD